jgi:spore coat protein CotF
LKRAGREYAWAAMETANPELRSFLQTAFMMSCSHAYEAWQYMVTKGYYPLTPAAKEEIDKIGSLYQVVPEDQARIQEYMKKYNGDNAVEGSSQDLYQ